MSKSKSYARFVNVVKYYPGQVIGLNNVSTELRPGTTGLLGPNGAGKSTFMKLFTGQIRKNSGLIEVYGKDPAASPEVYYDLGFCSEHDAFYEWMTLYEFIDALARVRGFSRSDAKEEADRVIEVVGLTDVAKERKVGKSSKGMRQRIKVAQSLIGNPRVLVLDEPLAGTDPVNRVAITNTIISLRKHGHNIIVSSHVLHEIERITREVQIIVKGQLLASGSLSDIRNLLFEKPHQVVIQGEDVRGLAEHLCSLPYVSTIEFTGNNTKRKKREGIGYMKVLTKDPQQFYLNFPKIVMESKTKVYDFSSSDEDLESIFKYLTT